MDFVVFSAGFVAGAALMWMAARMHPPPRVVIAPPALSPEMAPPVPKKRETMWDK